MVAEPHVVEELGQAKGDLMALLDEFREVWRKSDRKTPLREGS